MGIWTAERVSKAKQLAQAAVSNDSPEHWLMGYLIAVGDYGLLHAEAMEVADLLMEIPREERGI